MDLNIEPKYVKEIHKIFGPVSDYVNTHGHMDHITHVYAWEQLGTIIHAPAPEAYYLTDLHHFYQGYGWHEGHDLSLIEQFAKLNQFQKCKNIIPFKPGDTLNFEDFTLNTIPLLGHSESHTGFFLPDEKILHVSCLGFDQPKPGVDGFGPWYGFKQCSISKYLEDIDYVESIFIEKAHFLTSSHAYIANKSDTAPFDYMRDKIHKNQQTVDKALKPFDSQMNPEDKVNKLLAMDLFFPKSKMNNFLFDIYNFWEAWMIRHHIERSKTIKL